MACVSPISCAVIALILQGQTLILRRMNKEMLENHLARLDAALQTTAVLHVYGSAACILLDEPGRTSLDIDVAGPYSEVDETELRRAAKQAGIPVNPADDYDGDHIEWIGPLRLCLQPPVEGATLTLWKGRNLTIRTGSPADLVASKLVRYDETDRGDIQYLLTQANPTFADIAQAVDRLPAPFNRDALIRENLGNLKTDMAIWGIEPI